MKAWLNKVITHDRDTVGDFGHRVVIHIGIGFIMGLLDWNNGLVKLFIFYEKNEDLHTFDQAWKDTAGAIVGWVMGRLTLFGLIVWLILFLIKLLT